MCEAMEEILHVTERLEKSKQQGISQGICQGRIQQFVEDGREFGLKKEDIIEKLMSKFSLSEKDANGFYKQYAL